MKETQVKKQAILKCLKEYREELEQDLIKYDIEKYKLYVRGQLSMLDVITTFIDFIL